MTIAALTLVALVSTAGAFGGQTAAAPSVGFVLRFDGPWQLNGRDVKRGEGVPAGARLTLAASARFDTGENYALDIVLLNNKTVFCHSADACRAGVTVPPALNQNPSLLQRMSSVFSRIFDSPDRWVGLVSRGPASRLDLADAVIMRDGGHLILGRMLERAPAGRYRLTFLPVVDATPASQTYALVIGWTNAAPTVATVSVPPGLYVVTLTPEAPQSAPGREAWVMVTDAMHFAEAERGFADALAMTKSWGPDIPSADVTRFRHAYLADLASQIR